MALMTLSTAATAFTHNVPELLVCRVLTGIGFGGVIPASTALVSEFLPTRSRTSAVAFVVLGQSLGGLLAGLFMKTRLVSGDWQMIILQASVLCALMTALLLIAPSRVAALPVAETRRRTSGETSTAIACPRQAFADP